jgi:hypothetical protein
MDCLLAIRAAWHSTWQLASSMQPSATQRELGHLPPRARHDVSSQKQLQSAVSSQQELLRTLARMGTRVSVCAGRGSFAARIFR